MKKLTLDGLLQSVNEDSSIRNLIQSSPVCHKIFDPDFKLRFMSHSGVAALQIENIENFYGHTFPTDSAPKITRNIFNEYIRLAAKGETNTIEYSFELDGNFIWYRTTLSPFFDTDGNLLYITADSMDITEGKKTEMSLREAHDRLEVRVEERTKELRETNRKLNAEVHEHKLTEEFLKINEEKLKKYANELEKSNKEFESFAYLASHDLQETLRKIITFGDRLIEKSKDLSETDKNYLKRMQKAALRMRDFIKDLLEMSKIEATKGSFERTILNELVNDVLEDMEIQIKKTKGQVYVGSLPDLEVDPIQFSKLLQNLISNSLKYHKDGIPPIIRLDSLFNKKTNCWEIMVEDNGIGFDEKYLDRIFKPFERLHGKDEYEGTGIGLAICEKIVHSLEGKISATSKLGKGATFIISFPKK
jgi:PAS domain S-box-containing protein